MDRWRSETEKNSRGKFLKKTFYTLGQFDKIVLKQDHMLYLRKYPYIVLGPKYLLYHFFLTVEIGTFDHLFYIEKL
jgi:hypothetical protein